MRSQIAKQMPNSLRLRSINFIPDIRFIPLANLVKVLVEISLTFTTVVAAISLTSIKNLLPFYYQVSGGQFVNNLGAAQYDLTFNPGEIFLFVRFLQINFFGVCIISRVRLNFRIPGYQKFVQA